ncbi:MAG: YheT family hydrolase [Candidatus Cyclobacteriaceae bacterium M2_1C_046]
MPLIDSEYIAPWWLRNGDLATIVPNAFGKEFDPGYERERIITPDEDFLDLDWLKKKDNHKLLIISHGLEGSSKRPYIVRMADFFHRKNWDVLAWNCRSCSGEMNLKPRFYHHGATDDVEVMVDHALQSGHYSEIVMVGFSMGGNLTLRYLGEQGKNLHSEIKRGIAFSTPVDLPSSVVEFAKKRNYYYKRRFLKKLEQKVKIKSEMLPDSFPQVDFSLIKQFPDFDNLITAPIHGYKNAEEFYIKVSSKPVLKDIVIPTLIVNALDDPFLGPDCYPFEEVMDLNHVFLETPENGGHVGFSLKNTDVSYMETRAFEFIAGKIPGTK